MATKALASLADAPEAQPEERDLTQALPGLAKIAAGEVPGAYVPAGWSTPEIDQLNPSIDELQATGIQIYIPESTKGVSAVFVSPEVTEKDLKAADKAGKLTSLFPPISEVLGAPTDAQAPEQAESAPVGAATPPAAPAAQQAIVKSRLTSLADEEQPTERTMPGAGKLANSLLKRVI